MNGSIKQSRGKRKRGIVLTPAGLNRLQEAIQAMEIARNNGERWSLDELGDRMKVSAKTLSRLWSLHRGVDQKTLQRCFSAFNLELSTEDYRSLDEDNPLDLDGEEREAIEPKSNELLTHQQPDNFEYFGPYPSGPVSLDSPFYIERPPIEELAYREITHPGCVIRIRVPKEMGKSSLVLRLLAFAQTQGFRKVVFNCNQIDFLCLNDLNKLLRALSKRIATELEIKANLDDYWDEEIGYKLSCSFYIHHLLKQSPNPVVLVLNEVDRFFEYPLLAQEFFALLRSWYEEARQETHWQKLRLVVVYSTEEYVNLDINRSPFNIGLPLRLPEFTQQQVEELARRHGLKLSKGDKSAQLMSLVGGHPALVRIALYCMCTQGITLDELVEEALIDGGIYHYHLWRHWITLQDNPNLAETLTKILTDRQNLALSPLQIYKLESMGLIHRDREQIKLRCELYRAYFQKQLVNYRLG